jgi:signal transduction histidine kinase
VLLRRAIENVVQNAVSHTVGGGKVVLQAEAADAGISIRVRDFGPGVPEAMLAEIFRPFFRVQADRSRDSGGVGLGLAIAQRAIRLHHGSLSARNAQPGLEVRFTLPH